MPRGAEGLAMQADAASDEQAWRRLDQRLRGQDAARWNAFYTQRARPCPFFRPVPDESLVEWVTQGRLRPGRALDLGCGIGRNALYLAGRGFQVLGLDLSPTALQWAAERAAQAGAAVGAAVDWAQGDVFDAAVADRIETRAYDLVVDSGLFHHLAPHRRRPYLALVLRALKPGGHVALCCFRPEGGSGLGDDEVYTRGTLGGGLGYSRRRLRAFWSQGLKVRCLRRMRPCAADSGRFGERFLWVLLARKCGGAASRS